MGRGEERCHWFLSQILNSWFLRYVLPLWWRLCWSVIIIICSSSCIAYTNNKGCVTLWSCHFALKSIKKYLNTKEELWKLKYFTMQKYNLPKKKKPSKKNNPSRYYYNSIITNLKFQHKPKYHLSKILKSK
jgi:hypothetical protein